MKRFSDIVSSCILLMLMLLCTSGVSLEKCSCTGKISLALPTAGNCCPDEGGCMTVKTLQVSDYVPTATASIDIPVQPELFPVFCREMALSLPRCGHNTLCRRTQYADAPPGEMAVATTVLRV